MIYEDYKIFIYDVESLPNIFTAVVECPDGTELIFEVSERVNQSRQFLVFLRSIMQFKNRVLMCGYNNQGYDWPLLNYLLSMVEFTAEQAYRKSKEIIETDWNNRFKHIIWPDQQLIPQLDLMKVHGFDNVARSTSLKMLQIAMQMQNVVEFELDFNNPLELSRIPDLIAYNRWDVGSTKEFLLRSRKNIDLRLKIGDDVGMNLLNLSDVDMGEKIVIDDLERQQPGITGTRGGGPKRTTVRDKIALGDLVFDGIHFETPGFDNILQHFKRTTIRETKGVFDDLTVDFGGMEWAFGTGGIHAAKQHPDSTEKNPIGVSYVANDRRAVLTVDVSSYYPSLAVVNKLAPAHLGQAFVNVYTTLRDRKAEFKAAKMKMEETAAKLSANAVFGKGGSKYSCLSDPAFMLSITINGQLLLCVLAEQLAKIPTLELIQANTDGITVAIDRDHMAQLDNVVQWWEGLTGLTLDYDHWARFHQRDVNNYLAVDTDGKVKGKGAFEWRIGLDGDNTWHKNQSSKIITIAAEEFLVNGTPVRETVEACNDPFRFMQTLKVARSDKVYLGGKLEKYEDTQMPNPKDVEKGKPTLRNQHVGGLKQQNVGRYYAALRGYQLYKIMKPTAKLPHHERPQAILKDVPTMTCNDVYFFDWSNLNREWYIDQAERLVASTDP